MVEEDEGPLVVEITGSEDEGIVNYEDVIILTSYMADQDYTVKDLAYAVEKPWKFVDVLAEAKKALENQE